MDLIKKFKKADKYTRYSIYTIILFSFVVLTLASIYHVSGDGCWYIPVGKFIATHEKFPLFEPLGRDEPFWSPPLYHSFIAAVYYSFNSFNHNIANFAIKFVSPIFGILALIFSFLVIKKLMNPKIAFYSTIFLAFVPIFIDYSVISYVESMLVFFVVLSVYFLINNKIFWSGIAAGLSILTKYNGAFIIPVLIYILYKKSDNKKLFCRNSLIIIALSFLVASPWLIRNWILLGNPVWPFLNFIFNGYQLKSYSSLNFANVINPMLVVTTYLGIFGVPDGNFTLLSFVNAPHLKFLLAVWLAGTLIFIIPLFALLYRKIKDAKTEKKIFIVWILVHITLFVLYVMNVGLFVSRIILPAFPAVALFWAMGFDKLLNTKFKKIIILLTFLVVCGFVFTAFAKTYIASNAWGRYQKDFEWVKSNTGADAIFIAHGQCVPYNIERTSIYLGKDNIKNANYIWVNQNFNLDRRSIFDGKTLKFIQSQNYAVVYSNKTTGTIIYKIK